MDMDMDMIMGREDVEKNKINRHCHNSYEFCTIQFNSVKCSREEKTRKYAYHLFSPDMLYSICLATERAHHNRVLDIRF